MANKFTKSVLERQYLEAKRGADRPQAEESAPEKDKAASPEAVTNAHVQTGESPKETGEAASSNRPTATELERVIPEPAGRTETAELPAAGIDEAFERVDSAPSQAQENEWETTKAQAETPQSADLGETHAGMGKPLSDLVESYLIRTPERVAKNKTFYLDEAVIAGIRASAKKQKVTESKLVNDILRGVLGVH